MNKSFIRSLAPAFCGGVLAMAMFSSCNNEKDLYNAEEAGHKKAAQQIINEYAAAFKAQYGEINSTNTWGFGQSRALTRGVNANANLWYYDYEVDPNVDEYEMNEVYNYVNRDLSNLKVVEQPNWTDFFVTHVWKGTSKSSSYPNQDGYIETVVGAEHMDELEVKLANGQWEHVFNFNNSYNGNEVAFEGDPSITAKDKTLMVNSGTLGFRHNNSQSSYRSEKYIVISGADIFGADSKYAGYYYVCFDFEHAYTEADKANETTLATINGTYEKKVVSGGDMQISFSNEMSPADAEAAQADIVTWLNNNKYLWVGSDYSLDASNIENLNVTTSTGNWGVVLNVTGSLKTGAEATESWETVTLNSTNLEAAGFYTAEELTAEKAAQLHSGTADVRNCNVTVSFKGYRNGNKFFTGDNYYTDWIVRISPAKYIGNEEPTPDPVDPTPDPVVGERVMCEDMGTIGDFDFNDVVFDVVPVEGGKTEVTILAAGGTLPIYLSIPGVPTFEVHEKLKLSVGPDGKYPMANTYNSTLSVPAQVVPVDGIVTAADIVITVKNPNAIEAEYVLTANPGEAPQKICVPYTVGWASEKQNIKEKYPKFKDYVNNGQPLNWWE